MTCVSKDTSLMSSVLNIRSVLKCASILASRPSGFVNETLARTARSAFMPDGQVTHRPLRPKRPASRKLHGCSIEPMTSALMTSAFSLLRGFDQGAEGQF